MRQSRLTRCTIKVTVKSIYFTCGSLKVTKTKFLFFKNVLHRELERKVEKVKGGTIQKKRDFYEKLPKKFFARVHIVYDSIFWQYSFFVNILFVYSDKLQF